MKKIIGILSVSMFAVTMFMNTNSAKNVSDLNLASLVTINVANAEEEDCPDDGVARMSCPIWVVTVTTGFPTNTFTCATGGTYKCGIDL